MVLQLESYFYNLNLMRFVKVLILLLTNLLGVEDIKVNAKDHKVIVKGKNADPLKVVERVRKKCNKHVELISPKPKPSDKDAKAKAKQDDDNEVFVTNDAILHYTC